MTEDMTFQLAGTGRGNRGEVMYGRIFCNETGQHQGVPHHRLVLPIPVNYHKKIGDVSSLPKTGSVLVGPFDHKYLTLLDMDPNQKPTWLSGEQLYLQKFPHTSLAAIEWMEKYSSKMNPQSGLPQMKSVSKELKKLAPLIVFNGLGAPFGCSVGCTAGGKVSPVLKNLRS